MAKGVDLKESGEILHRRLLANDPFASAEIAETFLKPLVRALHGGFHALPDPHLVESAAEDSLLSYLKEPSKFDPSRSSLLGYLSMDARGDLRNLLAKERRRSEKVVELFPSASEYPSEEVAEIDQFPESSSNRLKDSEHPSPIVRRTLEKITDATDRQLVDLMINGVRRTEDYAAVLGITNLPTEDQKKIVKRHKDRLKVTIIRANRQRKTGK